MVKNPKRPSSDGAQLEKSKKSKKNDSIYESQPPSQTLYVKNINDKINIHTLKHLLYLLFLTYGDVIDIVLNYKVHSMRGQAHIIFGNVQSSIIAMRSLQNFKFFEKGLQIQYSISPSKIITSTDEAHGSEDALPQAVEAV